MSDERLCQRCGNEADALVHLKEETPSFHMFEPTPITFAKLFEGVPPAVVAIDKNGRVLTAPSLMRVMVEDRPGFPQFGVLVGMLVDERDDMQAVVRLDHYGIMLKMYHPSKVTPVTEEQEASYK